MPRLEDVGTPGVIMQTGRAMVRVKNVIPMTMGGVTAAAVGVLK